VSEPDAPDAELELPAEPTSARIAREFGVGAARGWHLVIDQEALKIVISELVTNAVQHSEPPIHLRMRRRPASVVVEVDDAGPGFDPAVERSTSSRGLRIVAALSDDWGVDRLEHGQRAWAELSLGTDVRTNGFGPSTRGDGGG
jgi:anti-sigma regulatory factor (Ser/Thr protein kinase)